MEPRNVGVDLLTKHMVIFVREPWLLGSVSMVPLEFGFPDLLCFKAFRHGSLSTKVPLSAVVTLHSNIHATAGKE